MSLSTSMQQPTPIHPYITYPTTLTHMPMFSGREYLVLVFCSDTNKITFTASTIMIIKSVTLSATFRFKVLMLMSNSGYILLAFWQLEYWVTNVEPGTLIYIVFILWTAILTPAANKSPCHDVCHVYTFVTHDCHSKIPPSLFHVDNNIRIHHEKFRSLDVCW